MSPIPLTDKLLAIGETYRALRRPMSEAVERIKAAEARADAAEAKLAAPDAEAVRAREREARMERLIAEAGVVPLPKRGADELGDLRAAYGSATGGGTIPEGASVEEARAAYRAVAAGASARGIPWMGAARASGGGP